MTETMEDFLEHYGIPGMKWGVRRDDPSGSGGDFTVEKAMTIYNISSDKARELNGHVYGAFTNQDVLNYRGYYAGSLKNFFEADKVFSNSFEVKRELNVAGEKSQLDAFKKLWESDKAGVALALAQSQKDISIMAAIVHRGFKINRDAAYEKKFLEKDEKYMLSKGFKQFQQALATPENIRSDAYYKLLVQKGYNALHDLNDVNGYGSEKPILAFKGSDVFRKKSSLELSQSDIDLAFEAHRSKKTADFDIHALHNTKKEASVSHNEMSLNDFLEHYGIPGMKWGVRRKNPSGGSSGPASFPAAHKLSDDELRTFINRMQLERQYSQLVASQPAPAKNKAAAFVSSLLSDVGKRQVSRLASAAGDLAIEAALGKSGNANAQAVGKELQRVRTKKK